MSLKMHLYTRSYIIDLPDILHVMRSQIEELDDEYCCYANYEYFHYDLVELLFTYLDLYVNESIEEDITVVFYDYLRDDILESISQILSYHYAGWSMVLMDLSRRIASIFADTLVVVVLDLKDTDSFYPKPVSMELFRHTEHDDCRFIFYYPKEPEAWRRPLS